MQEIGVRSSQCGIEQHGIHNVNDIFWNLPTPALYEHVVRRREGLVCHEGPLAVTTGHHRGRSPNDKFIVREPSSDHQVWWGKVNRPFDPAKFDSLYHRLLAYLQMKDLYVQDGFAGADPAHRVPIRVITGTAWHSLFARIMFLRPEKEKLAHHVPEFTVIDVPQFHAVPHLDGTNSEAFIILNLGRRLAIIGGTSYAGEIKKTMFSVMNYLMPQVNVLPMHCSANMGKSGDVAIFFGLSGTGKTTLSADPERQLIGDDEHGWSDRGIFNFEGGCYAKVIRLSAAAEPQIYACTRSFGTVLENVTLDTETRLVDLDDESLTENTRAAYSLPHFDGLGLHPLRRPCPQHLHAHLRRFRRDASHQQADARPGQVPLPFRVHGQSGRNREGSGARTPGYLQRLLWRALHDPAPVGLRGNARGAHRSARRRLLVDQHRLDGRALRRRAENQDCLYPRDDPCSAGWRTEQRAVRTGPGLWSSYPRRRAGSPF